MLVEFAVKNYKSFRDRQVLSMVASSDTSLPENTITTPTMGKQRLLRSAVFYGANASGKSNLISAMGFVKAFIGLSAQNPPETKIPVKPFLLGEYDSQSPSEFEITFIQEDVRYQYGFIVNRQTVFEEWLIAYPQGRSQTWYERKLKGDSPSSYEWYFGSNLKGEKRRLVELAKPNTLFLSVAATFNHEQLSKVYKWFDTNLWVVDIHEGGPMLQQATTIAAHQNISFQRFVGRFLKLADLGITHLGIMTSSKSKTSPDALKDLNSDGGKDEESEEISGIFLLHQSKKSPDLGVPLPWEDESLGTRRLFDLAGVLMTVLSNGATLFVDELDGSIHPSLVRSLVTMFHKPNPDISGSQIVFNTHDVTLLDSLLFRRDQIWLVEKDNEGASHIYPLLEFSPRKDEALAKGYLQGRYGAVPFIREDLLEGLLANGKE